MSWVFQVIKYNISDDTYEHFDFPQWEKTFIGAGRLSNNQEGIGDGEKDVCICDYRVWTATVKDVEQICKEKVFVFFSLLPPPTPVPPKCY